MNETLNKETGAVIDIIDLVDRINLRVLAPAKIAVAVLQVDAVYNPGDVADTLINAINDLEEIMEQLRGREEVPA